MLLIGIVAVFISLIIMPLNAKITASKAELSLLLDKKALIDAKLPLATTVNNNLEKATAKVNEGFAQIESPLFSAEFERWALPFLTKYGVTMTKLEVNDPVVTAPSIPSYENNGYQYNIRSLVDSYNQTKLAVSTIPTTSAELIKTSMKFTFNSSYVVYRSFLDTISSWNTTAIVTASDYKFDDHSGIVQVDYYTVDKLKDEANTVVSPDGGIITDITSEPDGK